MLCVFFFFVCEFTRTCRNNASIFNFSSFSGLKVNLVGLLGRSFLEFPNTPGNTKKKLRKNGNFYVKPVFDKIDFLYGCNSKTNHCKYLKFSPNVYVSVIFIHVDKKTENLKQVTIFFINIYSSNFYDICRKYLKISSPRNLKHKLAPLIVQRKYSIV
ncbi:Uncharacterized protein FWK35_00029620, partial [Aphis craccivora]